MRNLEKALSDKGISKAVVANLLNINRNTVANKISGKTEFTIEEAFKIKEHLLPEYDLEYLFAETFKDVA